MYGPDGLGKLSAGGHPRRLTHADQTQPKVQTGVNDAPTLDKQQQPADVAQSKQQPIDSAQSKQQVGASQEQSSQEHTQQQVRQQFSEGVQGNSVTSQAQAKSTEKADCFAVFNPPTEKEYQEVCPASTECTCLP